MTPVASQRFRGFDGLRAVAILLVVSWHGALASRFPVEAMGALRPIVMTGWAGVDLFFALSGFLITSLLLREERHNEGVTGAPWFSLRAFYLRRVLRIMPVFYVVFLLATFVFSLALPSYHGRQVLHVGSWLGLWPYATFWGNYFVNWPSLTAGHRVWNPGEGYTVLWSLCVEEHFYLLWPALLAICKRPQVRLVIALTVCVALMGARWLALARLAVPHQAIHALSHFRIDSILWGAAGAIAVDRWPAVLAAVRVRRIALASVGVAITVLVGLGALSVLPPPTPLGISVGLTLLAVFSTLLLGELVGSPASPLVRVLELRPIAWLGRLSYAMYLVHFAAIDVGRRVFFSVPREPTLTTLLQAFVLFVGISVAAAAVLHYTVERPFLRLRDRLHVRPPPQERRAA